MEHDNSCFVVHLLNDLGDKCGVTLIDRPFLNYFLAQNLVNEEYQKHLALGGGRREYRSGEHGPA